MMVTDLYIRSETQPMIHAEAAIRYRVTILAVLEPQSTESDAERTGQEVSW
jgi:hypothetical protein